MLLLTVVRLKPLDEVRLVALGSVALNFFFEVACVAAQLLGGCGTLRSFYGVNFGVVFL